MFVGRLGSTRGGGREVMLDTEKCSRQRFRYDDGNVRVLVAYPLQVEKVVMWFACRGFDAASQQ